MLCQLLSGQIVYAFCGTINRPDLLPKMSFRASAAQLRCKHVSQSLLGSNGDQRRVSCTGCGKVLFLWFHKQANKSLMQRHLNPEWVWVENTESPDRGSVPDDDEAACAVQPQEDIVLIPAEPESSPSRDPEKTGDWTVVPNRCKDGRGCNYCVEEAQWGQESF